MCLIWNQTHDLLVHRSSQPLSHIGQTRDLFLYVSFPYISGAMEVLKRDVMRVYFEWHNMLLKSKEFRYFGAHILGCLLVHQKQLFKSRFLHIDKRFSSSSCSSMVATVLRQMVLLCVVRDVCFQGSFLKR